VNAIVKMTRIIAALEQWGAAFEQKYVYDSPTGPLWPKVNIGAQSHTPCNRCVRFAATVASGHATLATKRTLLLTWAGLAPAGSHQLCLAHLFDHLIGD
jgi:hypothetical protein